MSEQPGTEVYANPYEDHNHAPENVCGPECPGYPEVVAAKRRAALDRMIQPDTSPRWAAGLRQPFPDDQISAKPRVWCPACRNSPDKVCNRHHVVNPCKGCKQKITDAHFHLDYVGHADTTSRLLEVDPEWYWEPAYKDVDKDVLLAAISTGNAEIVSAVIDNAPPLLDRHHGMWMQLIVHNDQGAEVATLCYGDPEGKTGPNAIKETIGDGVRNGAMRRGVAVDLWSKSDHAEQQALTGQQEGAPEQPRKTQTRGKAKVQAPAPDVGDGSAPMAGEDPGDWAARRALVAKALELSKSTNPDVALDVLKDEVYEVARKNKWLRSLIYSPFTHGQSTLSDAIAAAKSALLSKQAGEGSQEA